MSPRPKRHRKIAEPPNVTGFIPENEEYDSNDTINLLYEEFEAIKLADYDNLSQLEASKLLEVSRPTFTRIYDSALKKIAKALVEQKRLVIGGGNVVFDDKWFICQKCETVFKETLSKSDNKENKHICPVCNSEKIIELQHADFTKSYHQHKGHGKGQHKHYNKKNAEGKCICPKCENTVTHTPGIPCNSVLCPKCNIRMIREGSFHHQEIIKLKKKKL